MTHKWCFTVELEFDRPSANAEEERRACVALEAMIVSGAWDEMAAGSEFHLTPRGIIAVPGGRMP